MKNIESWNIEHPHTLFTILKKVRKKHDLSNPVVVKIPEKYRNIVESLDYYDNGLVGSNFIINFINDLNVIKIDKIELKIEPKKEIEKI